MHERAYTLVELLVTISIVAILATLALPSYFFLVNSSRHNAEINEFIGGAMLTRSEAVKRGQQTALCTSVDGTSCSTVANWDEGWIAFVDSNANDVRDSSEVLVKIREAMKSGFSFRSSGSIGKKIRFQANGMPLESGTLTLCDPRGVSKVEAVIVTASGRAKRSDSAMGGGSLSCP